MLRPSARTARGPSLRPGTAPQSSGMRPRAMNWQSFSMSTASMLHPSAQTARGSPPHPWTGPQGCGMRPQARN
jgi:hypothetical protein